MSQGLFIPRKTLVLPPEYEKSERAYREDMLAIERWSNGLGPGTRLILPDHSILSGDVDLVQGNGVLLTKVGNGVRVTASLAQMARTVPAFAPGAAVARVLQRMTVTDPVLRQLDIYLGAAPVGVNAANCANVVVQGTAGGGPVIVPLTAGVAEYHLGLANLIAPLAGALGTGASGTSNPTAYAYEFQVTTNVTVSNLDVLFSGGTHTSGTDIRAGIATGVGATTPCLSPDWVTDADGIECFADIDGTGVGAGSRPLWTLPSASGFTLSTGTNYWLVVALTSRKNPNQLGIKVSTGVTALGNFLNVGSPRAPSFLGGPGDWYADVFDTAVGGGILVPTFNLYGAVMGTPLLGLVEISQTITGAPPATTGTDANIVAQV